MKLHRIYAVLLRHMYLMRRNIDKQTEVFYWITMDIFIWGMTSVYFQNAQSTAQNIVFAIMAGVLLWNMVYRAQSDFSNSILEDLWNKNLVNIFVSPLTFSEWLTSLISLGVIKGAVSFLYSTLLVLLVFKVNLFQLSFYIPVFIFLLFMTGWSLGFIISGLILRFGTKVQAFSWTSIWILSPFSAIYFPLSILPEWAQFASRAVPTSYIFEEVRRFLATGSIEPLNLLISFVLNVVYFSLAAWFLRSSFIKVLEKGLVKVY